MIGILRKIINRFKQPIYKEDIQSVLINAFLSCITIGALSGVLNYFFGTTFNFTLMIFNLMVGYFVGIRIRKAYFTNHILYRVLAVLFTFLGLIIGFMTEFLINVDFKIISFEVVKLFFLQFNIFSRHFYNSWSIVNVLVYLVTLFIGYKIAKGYE